MKTKLVTTLCLPIAALLVLAGCGGGGSKANASTTTNTGGSASRSAFTKCLSDHGVTLPAGFGQGGGNGGPPANGSRPDFGSGNGSGTPPRGPFPGSTDPKFQQAFGACRSQLPNGGRGGFGGGANSQAFQAYTSCLRDHGVNVPTTTAGGSATPGSRPDFQNDPKFASANQTCRALLPTNSSTPTTSGS